MAKAASLSSSADLFPRLEAISLARTRLFKITAPPRRPKAAEPAEMVTALAVVVVPIIKVASATDKRARAAMTNPLILKNDGWISSTL